MQEPVTLTRIFSEVDDIIQFIHYGKDKLDNFTTQLDSIEKKIPELSDRSEYPPQAKSCIQLNSSIQTTGKTLIDWKTKANQFLRQIHQMAQGKSQKSLTYLNELQTAESKITQLLMLISGQNNGLKQLQERLKALTSLLEDKKRAMQPNFERATDPRLVEVYS